MTGIAPVEGYAVGFHLGAEAGKAGKPCDPSPSMPPQKRMGYVDGWEWAGGSKADPVERSLIDNDFRDHYGDLRYEPPSRAARALALDVAEGTGR
jgi:hypothetical protein